MLQKYGIAVTQEEVERVDTVRYLWHNLNQKIGKIVSELLLVQNNFKSTLLDDVEQFNEDCDSFVGSYNEVSCFHLVDAIYVCVTIVNHITTPCFIPACNLLSS